MDCTACKILAPSVCACVRACVRAKSCRTLCHTIGCGSPGSVLGILCPSLCPWDSPGKNAGVGCHPFLQGIVPTQGLSPSLLQLLHGQWVPFHGATRGSPLSSLARDQTLGPGSGSAAPSPLCWPGNPEACVSDLSIWVQDGAVK